MLFSKLLTQTACLAALLGASPHALAAGSTHLSLPSFFEPSGATFVGRVPGSWIEVSPGSLRLMPRDGSRALNLRWSGAAGGALRGEQPTGGVSNYFPGSDQAAWRPAVPHYGKVRMQDLYPGVDVVYYVDDGRLEFDLEVRPGIDPGLARLQLPDQANPAIDSAGQLTMESSGLSFRFKRPRAYQLVDGKRQEVACSYSANKAGEVRFELGRYDHARPLVIDPIIEYMTYLGGSGIDEVHAIGVDSAGNVIAGGITTSSNFPGAAQPLGSGLSIFITKLSPSGSAVIFTTILGTDPFGLNYFYQSHDGGSALSADDLRSIASDGGANTYATGRFGQSNFPTTLGAWRRDSAGGFAVKLDPTGQLVYSTMLGPPAFGLNAQKIRVRNGVAYLAGSINRAEFLGTAGALQRNMAGGTDLFALGLAQDGSGPTFLTAFGGSGQESFSDMDLDANGNLILAGTSNSPNLPLTSDALGYSPPAAGTNAAMLVRIDSTGSRLLYSTWLGTSSVNGVVVTPDGNYVLAGYASLPSDLTSIGTHNSINLGTNRAAGYIAKFSSATNRPLWSTDIQIVSFLSGAGMSSDGLGNLYWTDLTLASSGGAIFPYGQGGPLKLSADGATLLYSSPINAASVTGIAAPDGTFYIGGWTSDPNFPVSSGALQPHRDPAPARQAYSNGDPLNYSDGFLGKLDLGGFARGNFFVTAPPFPNSLTWRIGQPLPKGLAVPVALSGDPGTLTATGSSRLTATYNSGAPPSLTINAEPTQTVAGTFIESVTLSAQNNPDASLSMPVPLTVQPPVDFSLAASQAQIRLRQGQPATATTVGITPAFGAEDFSFQVDSSNRSVFYGSADCYSGPCQLKIRVTPQPPGTYNGTLTVSLAGLQNPRHTLQVQYIVDPPGTLLLSSTSVQLHIVKGQPVQPVKIDVTGSAPGVGWTATAGVSRTWLNLTQTAPTTPGQIVITADPSAVELGYWVFGGWATSESGQQTPFLITVDVSSGAPFDVTPNAVSTSYMRGGEYAPPSPTISLTAATPKDFSIAVDQPWVKTGLQFGTTPEQISLRLDTTLPEGKYHATLTVTAAGTAVQVPIDWEVYDIPKLAISATSLSFQYRVGDPPPAAQQIKVTCPTLHRASFLIGYFNTQSRFSVDPLSGTTPVTLNITVNVQDLQPGTYRGQFSIQAAYGSTGYFNVPMTLTVLPQLSPPPVIGGVFDSASGLQGVVSPGEILSIRGSRIGPAGARASAPGSNGKYPASLGGSTIYFDKIAAPILYSSDSESLVVAPVGIAGQSTTSVTVVSAGVTSKPVTISVAATNPGLFTADSSGYGLASALNVRSTGSTTPHSKSNPAAPGSVVALFATGLGVTSPPLPDGVVVSGQAPTVSASIQAFVGATKADILAYGPLSGAIAGLMRIDIRIPQGISSGLVPVVILAGENPSQTGVTLAIK